MNIRLLLILLIFAVGTTVAQKAEFGEKFDYDTKSELDPKFVLIDNYNYYLLSAVNKTGLGLANNQIILRKFDQKNTLVETITHPFPVLEGGGTLHNFIGSFAIGSEKAVVFTQSYSGKSKRDEVYQHVYDKTTKKFTSTLIMGFPITSVFKSGNVKVVKSENGAFFFVNYMTGLSRKEPEVNQLMVLNGSSLTTEWKKEITFTNDFLTHHIIGTNSGKAIYVRNPNSHKQDNYLEVISENEQNELKIGENINIHEPVAISIETQDYLLAFNHTTKGIRRGDFGDLLLYDLSSGTILQNNRIDGFNSVAKIKEVNFRYIVMQNNEIAIFTQAKVDATPKPTPGTMGFPEKKFTYGPSFLITLNFEGVLKSMKSIPSSSNNEADLYHAYGLVNAKGQWYVHAGFDNGFYKWEYLFNNEKLSSSIGFHFHDDVYSGKRIQYINQLLHYFPDTNKFLFAKITTTNDRTQMAVGTFSDVK